MKKPILQVSNLSKHFGGVIAVSGVDLQVFPGEITGVIGPNGAGKTTLFNNITGMDVPTSGKVEFRGEDLTGLAAWKITRKGISRTFQNIRLFKEMTVLENVMIGRHYRVGEQPFGPSRWSGAIKSYIQQKQERLIVEAKTMEWLEFFGLQAFAHELAKNLPYGKQRELEIARAMVMEPKLLFLDEPAAGMNPAETDELMTTIRRIKDLGVAIVLIEHDMKLVMNICDVIHVLYYGQKLAEGTPREIQNNQKVREAYLGGDDEDDDSDDE